MQRKISFEGTKSVCEEESLLPDCMARITVSVIKQSTAIDEKARGSVSFRCTRSDLGLERSFCCRIAGQGSRRHDIYAVFVYVTVCDLSYCHSFVNAIHDV